ncbi:hypothetical protein Nepgr_021864 [Nepenthes gracilis]|uniref:PIR2-like helical domain-containing protein n=1 Tax=Nepenthes gracilis TaxID=150966 RepID=A0AAD3XWF6_NEPGR|nr:hypothetical protein Nepgr_021864 [Nepenthes gracilis]
MASMVVKASSNTCSDVCPAMSVQEKGSKNKRKFWADTHLNGLNEALPLPHNECPSYEFFAEKFETTLNHVPPGACNILNCSHDYSNYLRPDLGLPSALGSSDVGTSHNREEGEANEFQDADWNDLTESQLEELVLSNLDAIFKNAIRKIVACGYSKEVATKAVLSSGLFYGCKDPVSNVVDNTLAYLRNGQEIDSSREHCFEDLQQLEKYVLAELICVLREVRPFFSTGDAMWSLLICDMNISHAFAMDSGPLSSFLSDGTPNVSSSTPPPPSETETKSTDTSLANLCKPISTTPYGTQLDMDTVAAAQISSNLLTPLICMG